MASEKKTAIQTIMGWVKAIQRNRLIMALVMLVQGIMIIWNPIGAMLGGAKLTAVLIAVAGILTFLGYLRDKNKSTGTKVMMAVSACIAGIGVWSFFQPGYLAAAMKVIIGVMIALNGLGNLLQAWKLEKKEGASWWISLIAAFAAIVIGVLLVIYPFDTGAVLERFMAVSLVYTAINDLWAMYQLRKASKAK